MAGKYAGGMGMTKSPKKVMSGGKGGKMVAGPARKLGSK